MSKVIAFFDFDGTLTVRDSLIPFLLMVRGTPRFILDVMTVSMYLIAFRLGLIRNDVAKEALIRKTLGRKSIVTLRNMGEEFARESIPHMLRTDTIKRMQKHKAQGHCCVLVSASLNIYLEPWARAVGFDHCLASSLEVGRDDLITGKLDGKNCHGEEKIRRIRLLLEEIGTPQFTYGYGDSRGDLPMLRFVNQGYLVKNSRIEFIGDPH
jgi:phosphatidylglycerophosphatase C